MKFLDKETLKPSIFGSFDGLTSLLGVFIPLLSSPNVIFSTCLCLGVSSAVSMGLGEYLSIGRVKDSLYMGVFTGLGCVVPAVPFLFFAKNIALLGSIGLYFLSILGISWMKSLDIGWRRAVTSTFLVSLIAFLLVLITTLIIPISG